VRDHHVEAQTCPACGANLDGAFGVTDDKAPEPGDVSVCLRCGAGLVFGIGRLYAMTEADAAALARRSPTFARTRYVVLLMREGLARDDR
jgi:hypothetical protein